MLPSEIQPTFKPSRIESPALESEKRINTRASEKVLASTEADALFETSYIPEDVSRVERILEIMNSHRDILSVSKTSSKVFQDTCLKFEQFLKGEFLYAYTWDKSWFTRISEKYPVTDLKFTWDELVSRVNDVLDYVHERQPYGYWWPSKRNNQGKIHKSTLSNFLATPMKSGNWWSPFLELVCGDCLTPRMMRQSMGEVTSKIVDEILKDVWFTRDFDTKVKVYKGVLSLKKWHKAVMPGLSSEAALHLSSFTNFLELIKQCNLETKCVGPTFIGSWSPKWSVLKDWLNRNYGVEI